MRCPDTPKSVINVLLQNNNNNPMWNKSWRIFYKIYYELICAMIHNSLRKMNWNSYSQDDIADITRDTFCSLFEAFSNGKYKNSFHFRGFLKQLVYRRTVDFIRKQNRRRTIAVESIEIVEHLTNNDESASNYFSKLNEQEKILHKRALIMDIWESIRPAYSPENAIIFEKRILEEESVTDICEELDIDRAKVDRTVHRIIKKIKEEISKENYSKELQ